MRILIRAIKAVANKTADIYKQGFSTFIRGPFCNSNANHPSGYPLMKPYKPSPVSIRYTQCWKRDECTEVPECPLFRTCRQVAKLRTAPHPHAKG